MAYTQIAKLYLFCGKMASGKSTLARTIAQRQHTALFSEDQLLEGLYPNEIVDLPGYVSRAKLLKATLRPAFIQLLRNGTSLVLDFPANTIEQRRWLLALCTNRVNNSSDSICWKL